MADVHMIKLLKKYEVAEGTMCFHFEKPTGFSYKAGQSADWSLLEMKEQDDKGPTRAFSFSSAPHEDFVGFSTRMRDSAFKRTLKDMPKGTLMRMEGPFGSFTLHENAARPAVFLSGGIGITPFRSIIADATQRGLAHKIYLFYSNRRPEDAAFLSELQEFEAKNPHFKLIATMTDMAQSSRAWSGEVGYITKEMIEKHAPEYRSAIFGLAGPSTMVLAMQQLLKDAGVSGDEIRFEEFAGY